MSDDSDDEFDFPTATRSTAKGKGKGKAQPAKKTGAFEFSMDSLLAESKDMVKRHEKITAGLDMDEVRRIIEGEDDTEKSKQQLRAVNAEAELAANEIMRDDSISIPGVTDVFIPSQGNSMANVPFDVVCPREELTVLFEAFKQSANDAADLEETLRGALVPWVRQKQGGKAPPELCWWLMRVLAQHDSPFVVLAAEEALVRLLSEPNKVWKLRYEDTQHVWRACGAIWLARGNDEGESGDGARRTEEAEEGGDEGPVRRNLGPSLNVVEACLRTGSHDMTDEQLADMVLDLCAAALDAQVCASCQTEVYYTLEAAVDSMSSGYYQDADNFSTLVDRICDPNARRLGSRVNSLSYVLLARNMPFKQTSYSGREGGGGADRTNNDSVVRGVKGMAGLSLRHEVCHRFLKQRFLKDTSYDEEDEPELGFSRTVKAIEIMLDDEDDITGDDTLEGYERQYVVVALANEMSAGALAVTKNGRPSADDCKRLLPMLDSLNKQMRDVMQTHIQMCKTLLDMMKAKLSPYVPKVGQQGTLSSFVKDEVANEGGVSDNDNGDEDESMMGSPSQSQ